MVIDTEGVLTKGDWMEHLFLLRPHMAKSLGSL